MLKKWLKICCFCLIVTPGMALCQERIEQKKEPREVIQKVNAGIDLYTKKNDAAGAIKKIEEAIQKSPKSFYANSWLGNIYLREGKYKQASDALAVAHVASPNDIGVLTNLATAYELSGEKGKATTAYEELNTKKPNDVAVLNKLGLFAMDRGDANKAVGYFESACAADSSDKMSVGNLAAAYVAAKQNEKAKAQYAKLTAMEPDPETMVNALSWLGYASIQAGQYDEAVVYLEDRKSVV